ncbi:thymidine kinase domain protein [Providencia alcalifaciens F90-2004]|nr:thymidine kinase domain protein [Providencia alcalifaciens F90-2004]
MLKYSETLFLGNRPMAQLYFYYSAMNAGKSTSLLQSSYNYHERGMRL